MKFPIVMYVIVRFNKILNLGLLPSENKRVLLTSFNFQDREIKLRVRLSVEINYLTLSQFYLDRKIDSLTLQFCNSNVSLDLSTRA